MPYYAYTCSFCQYSFEEKHSVEERNEPCEKPCPNCLEKTIQIEIGAVPNRWNCSKPTL